MENIILRQLSQSSKTPKPLNSHIESSLPRAVLASIQNIITTLGQQKSSFTRKTKATIKPIGIFLWKNFYSRLCKVLKRIGLLPSFLSLFRHSKTDCKAFPQPYRKEQKPSCMNLSVIFEKSEPIDSVTQIFCVPSQIVHSEMLPKHLKELVHYLPPKTSVSNPINEKALPMLSSFSQFIHKAAACTEPNRLSHIQIASLIKPQKAKVAYVPLPTIREEPVLSTLLEKLKVTREEFFSAASELFGEALVKRIQSWDKVSFPEDLTQNDLLHTFALMGHGVTTEDLDQLLTRVNKGEVFLQLSKKTKDFSKLPTEDIEKLIGFFRNPLEHLLPGEAKILWEELEKVLDLLPKDFNSKRVAYTKYEYHIHKLAEEAKTLTEEEKKLLFLAASEQLAKFVGYAKPDTIKKHTEPDTNISENMIIPIFTKEHGLIYYKLESCINEKGLHCYLFTSANKDLSLPAQLVFRGTDGIESLKRDVLDFNGIGKTVFDSYKEKIAAMVNNYCEATIKPALEICGHSLGAIDAQRATAFCVELFNEKVRYPHIAKLSHISCSAFCSPKLDVDTIDRWEKEVNKLKDSVLELQLNFAYHEKDVVTWAGYKNLFTLEDLATQTNLQANYLHVTSPSGLLTSTHHRTPFFKGARFDSTVDNRKYDFYTSTKLAELKAKQAELNALQKEILVFPNTTLDSINEPFVVLNFNENEQALEALELSMYEASCLLEKININQIGLSSKDSWLIYFLEKVFLAPVQATVSYLA